MSVDLLIVGAGPAGLAAAVVARKFGLSVTVIDEQPGPGGQIWRSIEKAANRDEILGESYVEGRSVSRAFRSSGADYRAGAQLWRIDGGFRAYLSQNVQVDVIDARTVLLATGAQERPTPIPGWTLPGVLTVGAAQILLKTAGEIPDGDLWIAGCGPLPLLYATQLLRAGGRIKGYLDTTPAGSWRVAARHLPAALRASRDLLKGLGWTAALHRSGVPLIRTASVEAVGSECVEAVRYRSKNGVMHTAECSTLLVHEGIVPSIHVALSLDCEMAWNARQHCFYPVLNEWGESTREGVFIAGDGAGIAGARAAGLRGELAAIKIVLDQQRISKEKALKFAAPIRRKLNRELSIRPFLDSLFRPREEIFAPADTTVICRCEEVTAGEIRAASTIGMPGPNQVKAATRSGMGPCQGRQCGYSVTCILSAAQHRSPSDVGYFHVRPPLKPVTLGELATLEGTVDP